MTQGAGPPILTRGPAMPMSPGGDHVDPLSHSQAGAAFALRPARRGGRHRAGGCPGLGAWQVPRVLRLQYVLPAGFRLPAALLLSALSAGLLLSAARLRAGAGLWHGAAAILLQRADLPRIPDDGAGRRQMGAELW